MQQSLQQGPVPVPRHRSLGPGVVMQPFLHLLPQRLVHDGGLFSGMQLALVAHLADVGDVGE